MTHPWTHLLNLISASIYTYLLDLGSKLKLSIMIYNVVDDACSTQGSLSSILSDMFDIKVEYYGNLVSQIVDLVGAADDANDEHLTSWAEACRKDNIQNTPLSPHIDSEVLLHKHLNLDGGKLRNLGFSLDVPRPSVEGIKEIIDDFVKMKVYPVSLAP